MEAYVLDWLNLLLRWLHLVTGIAWIGASLYFVWLDNHLLAPADPEAVRKGVAGELWAIHGGGFYNAQKYKVAPQTLPPTLHWFKWEAYWTWISGFVLLCLLYYVGANAYLIDRNIADIGPATAIAVGLGTLAGGWIVYDLLCKSPLGRNERALGCVLALLCVAAAYGLCHVFGGRGAYIHFGAMLGTIMVANVRFIIIPGQKELVRAKQEGRDPDPTPGLKALQRSKHNTYFTLPVLFTMISSHYPLTFAHAGNWLILVAMSVAGAAIRIFFVARHKGSSPLIPAAIGVIALAVVAIAIAPDARTAPTPGADAQASFARVQAVVTTRCAVCHSAAPTQPGFTAAPKGVMLDTPERIVSQAAQIFQQTSSKVMPIGNLTGMTDDEREVIAQWYTSGAKR